MKLLPLKNFFDRPYPAHNKVKPSPPPKKHPISQILIIYFFVGTVRGLHHSHPSATKKNGKEKALPPPILPHTCVSRRRKKKVTPSSKAHFL